MLLYGNGFNAAGGGGSGGVVFPFCVLMGVASFWVLLLCMDVPAGGCSVGFVGVLSLVFVFR